MRKCIYVLFCLLVSAAGCSKTPKCSDSVVKKTAIEASIMPFVNKGLIPEYFEVLDKLNEKDPTDAGIKKTFAPDLNALRQSKTPEVVDAMKKLDSRISTVSIQSIRTVSKDDTAKKCDCQADLVFPFDKVQEEVKHRKNITLPIKYSAQFMDDNNIRVEVNILY